MKIFPTEQVIYKENYGPYGPDFHQPNIWKCLSIILLCILFVHLYEQYQGKWPFSDRAMIQNDLKSTQFALNMTDNLAKKQIRKEQARLRQFETEFNNDFSIPVDIGEILTVKWP